MKENHGRARVFRRYFDVLPAYPATPTGLQSLQRGFFCGEAGGIMLRGDGAARFTVSALSVREHAFGEPRRAIDGFANAADFNNVDSD